MGVGFNYLVKEIVTMVVNKIKKKINNGKKNFILPNVLNRNGSVDGWKKG